jgi:DNA-directed RNA polymerase subunit beta'
VGLLEVYLKNQVSLTRFDGKLEIEDLKTVKGEDAEGNAVDIVVSRSTELKLVDVKTGIY